MEITGKGKFEGEIVVSSRIIDDLSSGLYHTPAACLKELINNSFDARATRVQVFVKPEADRIIIEDDGDGMNKEEFERHFKKISESHKRDESDITKGKPPRGQRPKIGKIGIGFIAANELCEMLEIYSTKEGSNELLHVEIDFKEMRKPVEQRKKGKDEIVKADYVGEILEANKNEHYTQLFLTEVRDRSIQSRQMLAGAGPTSVVNESKPMSLYGLSRESIAKILAERKFVNWKEFDLYSETMLNVGLNIPVQYNDNWMPTPGTVVTDEFEQLTENLGFQVFYDGSELRKPIVFRPPSDSIVVEKFDYKGDHVNASGYFYAQHGTIRPNDLQGVLIRIRNAAIGEYDSSFLGFPAADSTLIQKWISAEIWADDQLEDALNIDRRTLRQAHQSYVELRSAIHKFLRKFLNRVTNELYRESSRKRQFEKAKVLRKDVRNFLEDVLTKTAPHAAQSFEIVLDHSVDAKKALKTLERKYSVVEVMEIASEVGRDVLTPKQLSNFLEKLSDRLLNG